MSTCKVAVDEWLVRISNSVVTVIIAANAAARMSSAAQICGSFVVITLHRLQVVHIMSPGQHRKRHTEEIRG